MEIIATKGLKKCLVATVAVAATYLTAPSGVIAGDKDSLTIAYHVSVPAWATRYTVIVAFSKTRHRNPFSNVTINGITI